MIKKLATWNLCGCWYVVYEIIICDCDKIILRYYKASAFTHSMKMVFGEVPHPWNAGVVDVPVRDVVSGGNSRGRQSAVRVAHSRRRTGVPPAPVATNQSLVFFVRLCEYPQTRETLELQNIYRVLAAA